MRYNMLMIILTKYGKHRNWDTKETSENEKGNREKKLADFY